MFLKKSMTILGEIFLVVGAINLFVFDIPSRFSEWYYAVYLAPKAIFVDKNEWSTTKSAEIVNNNPYPIYNVQLKILEDETGTNIDSIVIKPESYIISTNFSSSTDMNAFVISGVSKIDGRKWKVTPIYKIDAHSSININLVIPPSNKPEEFRLKIMNFNKESNDFYQRENSTLVKFKMH